MSKGGQIAALTGMTLAFEGGAGEALTFYGVSPQFTIPVTALFCITTILLAWINKEDPISLLIKKISKHPEKVFKFIEKILRKLLSFALLTILLLISAAMLFVFLYIASQILRLWALIIIYIFQLF